MTKSKVIPLHNPAGPGDSLARYAAELDSMPLEDIHTLLVESVARASIQEIEQGRILTEIRDTESYTEGGYKSVYELAKDKLGMTTGEVKRLMALYAKHINSKPISRKPKATPVRVQTKADSLVYLSERDEAFMKALLAAWALAEKNGVEESGLEMPLEFKTKKAHQWFRDQVEQYRAEFGVATTGEVITRFMTLYADQLGIKR